MKINGKKRCVNCFEETTASRCPFCKYDPSDSAADPTLLPPGSIVDDKYVIGGVIGIGGFGVTYIAFDKESDKKIAVKEFFPYEIAYRERGTFNICPISEREQLVFEASAEKFYDEAKIISRFENDPNVVKLYEIFRANNTIYFTMELLNGKTLKEYIHANGVLDAAHAFYAARSVLNTLISTHSAGVLHRDISPENIILCANGDVKLIDFGAARQVITGSTQNFSTIVKFGFAPPEQYQKKAEQGPWSDIYSLGATLYYALTADIPEDPMERAENDDTFGENCFEIDRGIWDIITKAVDLNHKNRYQSATEMLADMDKLSVVSQPIIFPEEKMFFSAPRFRGIQSSAQPKKGAFSKYKLAAAAAAAIAAACVVIFPIILSGNDPDTPEPISLNDSVPEKLEKSLIEEYPYFCEYETKPWYLNMDENEQSIYKIIYDGLTQRQEDISFPFRTYTTEQIKKVYFSVIYDNPYICDVGDYAKSYYDDNNNKVMDPDEFMSSIQPDYLNVSYDEDLLHRCINNVIKEADKNDPVESLRYIHDLMIRDVSVVARYTTQSCTHAYGSVVHKSADDMGFAQGFCVYAQALGLPCRVIDGTKNGEIRAWCAVKIDGTWYNVDVYGDLFAHNEVTKMGVDRNAFFHTYFLANDKHFKELGYVPDGGYEALGGAGFSADSPIDNYYIRHRTNEYFNKTAREAYDHLLETAALTVRVGGNKVSICVAPYLANELYDMMGSGFISDLKKVYGVSVSGFRTEYTPEAYSVMLSV